jgi:cob(I)alamin adenosyltransferase
MWYGSLLRRQGRSRPLRRYHSSRRRRNHCRLSGRGSVSRFRVVWGRAPAFIIRTVKIYTRTGDGGETGLFDGTRVSKADPRVAAYGDVDELNAWLGLARASLGEPALAAMVEQIQRDLFALGSRLADPSHRIAGRVTKANVTADDVARLEGWIDELETDLPALRRFILAGGSTAGAAFHVARTVCRRAERAIVSLGDSALDRDVLTYVNRLSDLLFVVARVANAKAGVMDVEW